jgi:hypothetical protein
MMRQPRTRGAAAETPIAQPPHPASAYTRGDITGDGAIDTHDLAKLERNLGKTASEPGWAAVAPADLDRDAELTVTDRAAMSEEIIYDDGTFKLIEDALAEAAESDAARAVNGGPRICSTASPSWSRTTTTPRPDRRVQPHWSRSPSRQRIRPRRRAVALTNLDTANSKGTTVSVF